MTYEKDLLPCGNPEELVIPSHQQWQQQPHAKFHAKFLLVVSQTISMYENEY